jgi:hypothetical protein
MRLGLWPKSIKSTDPIPAAITKAWKGKWSQIEQSMRAHKLPKASIEFTKARYARVVKAKTFGELFSPRDKARLLVGPSDERWYGSTYTPTPEKKKERKAKMKKRLREKSPGRKPWSSRGGASLP